MITIKEFTKSAAIVKAIFFVFCSYCALSQNIIINEAMSQNSDSFEDPIFDKTFDWIELRNTTNSDINLFGYYLTDDKTNLQKFQFSNPSEIVGAQGYRIFWASGTPLLGSDHLNFKLSDNGESIYLVGQDGLTIIDSLIMPKLSHDISYGKEGTNPAVLRYYFPASPGIENKTENAFLGILEDPTFSHESGFYSNAFSLTFLDTTPGDSIVYTLDSSDPEIGNIIPKNWSYISSYPYGSGVTSYTQNTKTSQSYLYQSGISVSAASPSLRYSDIPTDWSANPQYLYSGQYWDACKVVTAKRIKHGYISSKTVSKSYFNTLNKVNPSFPIVSLRINPKDLFEKNGGIYIPGMVPVSYKISNNQSEPIYKKFNSFNFKDKNLYGTFTYIENGEHIIDNQVRVNIRGKYSSQFPLKGFNLKMRDSNEDDFDLEKFGWSGTDKSNKIMLRNGGNDYLASHFKDALTHEVSKNMNLELMRYRPANQFLNGEYWGVINIRDRIKSDYLANKYGIEKNFIEINEFNVEGDDLSPDFESFLDFVKNNNMGVSSNFEYFKKKVNVNSLIDHSISYAFFGNWDAFFNNNIFWRSVDSTSTSIDSSYLKYNYVLYDMDLSLDRTNTFDILNSTNNTDYFYGYLITNTAFKHMFINRFADLLNTNYKQSNLTNAIDSLKNNIDGQMASHWERWRKPWDYSEWTSVVGDTKTKLLLRPNKVLQDILTEFSLGGTFNLNLNVAITDGYVRVNTVDIKNGTKGVPADYSTWTGKYFDNIPFQIKAIPHNGYKFSHWIKNGVTITDSVLTINSNVDLTYSAYFTQIVLSENPIPAAFNLSACSYELRRWDADNAAETYPNNMRFVYFQNQDTPYTTTTFDFQAFTSGAYNHTSRTRIVGDNHKGFSFINTSGSNSNPGYPIGKMGGAVLALNTQNLDSVTVSFIARTVGSNSRRYGLSLQYRIGDVLDFQEFDTPINYVGAEEADDSVAFENIYLPEILLNKPYVQLLWRYYYISGESGSRDQLGVDDIVVKGIVKDTAVVNNRVLSINRPAKIYSMGQIGNNSNVVFESQNSITLLPGFSVEPGSVFKAETQTCL
jgi:hypothetical protein